MSKWNLRHKYMHPWKGKQKQTEFMWNSTPACTPLNARNFVQTNRVECRAKFLVAAFFVRCFHGHLSNLAWKLRADTKNAMRLGFLQSFFSHLQKKKKYFYSIFSLIQPTIFFMSIWRKKNQTFNDIICMDGKTQWSDLNLKEKSDPHENV